MRGEKAGLRGCGRRRRTGEGEGAKAPGAEVSTASTQPVKNLVVGDRGRCTVGFPAHFSSASGGRQGTTAGRYEIAGEPWMAAAISF